MEAGKDVQPTRQRHCGFCLDKPKRSSITTRTSDPEIRGGKSVMNYIALASTPGISRCGGGICEVASREVDCVDVSECF